MASDSEHREETQAAPAQGVVTSKWSPDMGGTRGERDGEHVTSDIWSPPEGREQGIEGRRLLDFYT